MDQSESRSLGFLEVLWTGFRVWVGSFSWFLLISLAVSVPLIYLCAVVVGPSDRYAQWSEVRNPFWLLRGALCLLGLFIGASVFCTVLGNAVFLGPVGRRAKEASGEFPGAPNWSIRKAFALLLASAATTVTILVGLVLFIVPGVIWSVRLAFVGQVIAAEGVGFFGAFERSRELASLRPGKATAIVMLSSGLFCLLSWAYGSTLALPGLWGLPDLVQPLVVLPLVLPFVSACFSLLYFDARCAEEGRACSVRVRGGHPLLQLVIPVSVVVLWPLIEPRVIVEPTEPPVPPLSAMDLQLFSAVYHSDAQAVVTCLEKRAHVNAVVRDQTGDHKNYDMPLHVAARKGDVAVVKILLAHGADAKARNAEGGDWLGPPRPGSGLTPLGVALKEGHKEVADLLRQHGASE